MKSRLVLILTVATSLCLVLEQAAWAQRGGRGRGGGAFGRGGFGGGGFSRGGFGQRGSGGLWSRDEVQTELKLSDEQKSKLSQMSDAQRERQREAFQNFREMSDEQRTAAQTELRAQTQKELAQILSAPQLARLKQIELQQEGAAALARDEVAAEVGLSDEQKGKVGQIIQQAQDEAAALREEMQGAFRGGLGGEGGFDRDQMRQRVEQMRERSEQVNKQRDERLLAVLTEDQRDKWQQALGAPFELQQDEGFGGFRGGRGFGRGDRGRERVRPAAEPAEAEVDPQTGEKLIRFNFRFHPWDEVLDWFAQQAGLSLQADMKPTGTCNYTDPTAYTPTEALDRLNELLITKGFILIRKNQTLFCWELRNPIPPSLVPEVDIRDLDNHGENEMVTVKLLLERLVAEEAAEQLDGLKGPFGKVTALPSVNLLVITDTAGNVRWMRDALLRVDQAGGDGALRAFQLRYTQAKDVANQVRQLLGLPTEEDQDEGSSRGFGRGRSSRSDFRTRMFQIQRQAMERAARGGAATAATPEARVVADTRMNRVLVSAPPDQLALAAQAIAELDKPLGTGDPMLASQMEVHQVTRNDAYSVVTVLQEFLGEDSPVRLTAISSGRILASGSPSDQVMVRNLIREIEGTRGAVGGPNQKTIDVGAMDAEQLTELLRALWRQSGGENPIILVPGAGQSSLDRPSGARRLFTPQSLRLQRQPESRQGRLARGRSRDGEAAQRQREAEATGVEPTGIEPTQVKPLPPKSEPEPEIPAGSVTQRGEKTARVKQKGSTIWGVEQVDEAGFRYVSVAQEQGEGAVQAEEAQEAAQPDSPADTASQAPGKDQEAKKEKPPVFFRLENGILTVQSEDKEALERIERLLAVLVPAGGGQAPFYVAPLHEAEVTAVAQVIDRVLASTPSMTGEALGASTPQIIPDERTNSLLIVGATAAQRSTIHQLVEVLDTADLPENALNRDPQLIPVKNTSASEVAAVLQDVFAEYLAGERGGSRGSSNGQERGDFFARFQFGQRGGRGSRSSGATQTTQRSVSGRMTLGVDERTNTIVVSAPQALFEQVEDLVKQLDAAAATNNRSIRLVPVRLSNVSTTQETLSVLFGSGSGSGSSSNNRNGNSRSTRGNRGPSGFQGFQGFRGFQRPEGNTSFGGGRSRSSGATNRFTRGRRGSDSNNGGNSFRGRRGGGDSGGRGSDRGRRGYRGGNGGE